MKPTKTIKFSDIRQELINELKARATDINIDESLTLVEGFVNQPITMELSASFFIGGPTIPMIMVLGNKSGRIYLFALKALLKDIEF